MSARTTDGGPGPLTGLAGRLRRTIDALDETDGAKGAAHTNAVIESRLQALTSLVGQERPRTPREALLQVAVASAAVDLIKGNLEPPEALRLAPDVALVEGCLYGVRALLEAFAGEPFDERLSDYWMRSSCDPHLVLDRLAGG